MFRYNKTETAANAFYNAGPLSYKQAKLQLYNLRTSLRRERIVLQLLLGSGTRDQLLRVNTL
jgi:hypothetical protein